MLFLALLIYIVLFDPEDHQLNSDLFRFSNFIIIFMY